METIASYNPADDPVLTIPTPVADAPGYISMDEGAGCISYTEQLVKIGFVSFPINVTYLANLPDQFRWNQWYWDVYIGFVKMHQMIGDSWNTYKYYVYQDDCGRNFYEFFKYYGSVDSPPIIDEEEKADIGVGEDEDQEGGVDSPVDVPEPIVPQPPVTVRQTVYHERWYEPAIGSFLDPSYGGPPATARLCTDWIRYGDSSRDYHSIEAKGFSWVKSSEAIQITRANSSAKRYTDVGISVVIITEIVHSFVNYSHSGGRCITPVNLYLTQAYYSS